MTAQGEAASPLRAVLAQLRAGAPTLDEVARRTGLDRDVVGAAAEHLVRLGRVTSSTLSTGCAGGGCGGCGSGSSCDAKGSPAPAGRRPVLVALRVRSPDQAAPATVADVQARASR